MYAHAVLTFLSPSIPFSERTLSLEKPVRIVRANVKSRPNTNNAVFDCKCMSRHHANIWFEDDNFYLSDMESSNGTYVNGKRLTNDTKKVAVFTGDVIQFGATVDSVCPYRKTVVTHLCVIATLQLYKPGDLSNIVAPLKTRPSGAKAAKLSINQSVPTILPSSTSSVSECAFLTDSTARSLPDANRPSLLDELNSLAKDESGTGMNKKTVKTKMVILSLVKLCNLGSQVLPEQLQELLLTDLTTLRQDLESCVERCDGDSSDVSPVRLDDVVKYASENDSAVPMQTDDDNYEDIITNVEDTLNESENNDGQTKQNSGDTLDVGSDKVEKAYSASALIALVRTGLSEEQELCALRLSEAETAIKSIADLVCKLEVYVKDNLTDQERIVEMANFETKRVKTNEELQELNKKVQEGKSYRDQLKEGKSILEAKFETCARLRKRSDGMRHLSAEIAQKVTMLEGELSKVEHLPTLTISEAELRDEDTDEEEQVEDDADDEMDVEVTSDTDMLKSAEEVQLGTKDEKQSGPIGGKTVHKTKEKQVRLSGTFEYRNKRKLDRKMQGDNTKAQKDKIRPTETVKTNAKYVMSRFTTQAGKELHLRGTNLMKEKLKSLIEVKPDDGVNELGLFDTNDLHEATESDDGGPMGNSRLRGHAWESSYEEDNQNTAAEFYGRFTRERVFTDEGGEFTKVEPSRGSINLNAALANDDDESDMETFGNVADSPANEDDENVVETFGNVADSPANEDDENVVETFANVAESHADKDDEKIVQTFANVTDSHADKDDENDVETFANVAESHADKDDENDVETFANVAGFLANEDHENDVEILANVTASLANEEEEKDVKACVKDLTDKYEQSSDAAKINRENMIMEEAEKVARFILSEIEPTEETNQGATSDQYDETRTDTETPKDDRSETNCTLGKDGGMEIYFKVPEIYLNDVPMRVEDFEGYNAEKVTEAILNNNLLTAEAKTVDKIMFNDIMHSGNAEVIYVNNVLVRDGATEPLVDSFPLQNHATETAGSLPSEMLCEKKAEQTSEINKTEKNVKRSVEENLADMTTTKKMKISAPPYEPRMQYTLDEHKKPSECLTFGAVTSTEETEESAKGDESTVKHKDEDQVEVRGGVNQDFEEEPIARGDRNVKQSLKDSERKEETDLGKMDQEFQEQDEKAKTLISKLVTEADPSQERATNPTVNLNKEKTEEMVNATLEQVQEPVPNMEVESSDAELENTSRGDERAEAEMNGTSETKLQVETEFNVTEPEAASGSEMGIGEDEILVETESSSLDIVEDEILVETESSSLGFGKDEILVETESSSLGIGKDEILVETESYSLGFGEDEIPVETESSSFGNRQQAPMKDEVINATENTEEQRGVTDGNALEYVKDSGQTVVIEQCAMEQSEAMNQGHKSGTVGIIKETEQDLEDERSKSEKESEQPQEGEIITKGILDETKKDVEYCTMELSDDVCEYEIVVKVTENAWESEEIEERAREKLDETVQRATSEEGITQEDDKPVLEGDDKSTCKRDENAAEQDAVAKHLDNLNDEDERVEVTEAIVNEAYHGEGIDSNALDKSDVTKCQADDIDGVFKLIFKARTTIRSASSSLHAEIVRRDSQLQEELLGDSTDGETDSDDDGYDQRLAEREKEPPPTSDSDRASGEPYTSRRRLKKTTHLPDVCARPLQMMEDFDDQRTSPMRYFVLPLIVGLLAMFIGIHYIVTQE